MTVAPERPAKLARLRPSNVERMAKSDTQNLRCNTQIRISPVRLIDHNDQQVGIVETAEALRIAQEAGLDLVEVAPTERPPVCRVMDYGKWKYQQKKHVRKHHEQAIKEVRLRPKTDDHDREIKLNRALRFLKKGAKVQFRMRFRGRERAHREIGYAILQNVAHEFDELVKVERPPSMDGRDMVMVLAPNKAALDKLASDSSAADPGPQASPA
jgi:translation initiation factor IF-3